MKVYRELKLNHDCRFAAKQSEIVSMRFGRAGIHNIKTRTGAVGGKQRGQRNVKVKAYIVS